MIQIYDSQLNQNLQQILQKISKPFSNFQILMLLGKVRMGSNDFLKQLKIQPW